MMRERHPVWKDAPPGPGELPIETRRGRARAGRRRTGSPGVV
ncbi:MAG TPA: hypothetical protein VNT55_05470 [Baekduia sp.]|nr:hypothetical protein [Baekduia sp.]